MERYYWAICTKDGVISVSRPYEGDDTGFGDCYSAYVTCMSIMAKCGVELHLAKWRGVFTAQQIKDILGGQL